MREIKLEALRAERRVIASGAIQPARRALSTTQLFSKFRTRILIEHESDRAPEIGAHSYIRMVEASRRSDGEGQLLRLSQVRQTSCPRWRPINEHLQRLFRFNDPRRPGRT